MKNFIFIAFISICLSSCKQSGPEADDQLEKTPTLTLVDSMQIDRLVVPTLLDYSFDGQYFLFFDFQSDELILTDSSGTIIRTANRSGDGPDSYKSSYFTACRFVRNEQIFVETYTGNYLYDLQFNLIESSPSRIQIMTRMMGDTQGFLVEGGYQFRFGYLESDLDKIRMENRIKMGEYDFLKVSNFQGDVLFSSKVPTSLNYIQKPGDYIGYDPVAKIHGDRIDLQFMLTPMIYTYSYPELVLKDSLFLDPGSDFKPIQPAPEQENFGIFFEELRGSRYKDFIYSNDFLLTWYLKATPDEEVDALDRRVVGDERYMSIEKKYKTPVYQIFKGKEKIWEGEWPIKLMTKKDLLYSVNAKPGEDANEVERDVQTFYFYELK